MKMLSRLRRSQAGFTLLELVVALFITSLIALTATSATALLLNQGIKNSDYTAASKETMNAIYWIGCDAQMSQRVQLDGGATGFPLVLQWTEWDNSEHEVTYSITDGEVTRSHSVDGGAAATAIVARNINMAAANTSCSYANGVLSLKVTATVGDGSRVVSAAKERAITSRPSL